MVFAMKFRLVTLCLQFILFLNTEKSIIYWLNLFLTIIFSLYFFLLVTGFLFPLFFFEFWFEDSDFQYLKAWGISDMLISNLPPLLYMRWRVVYLFLPWIDATWCWLLLSCLTVECWCGWNCYANYVIKTHV